jgi:hypothetical protein
MRVLILLGWIPSLLALAACDVTFLSISTDGRIDISVATNGTAFDIDGYSVSLDGNEVRVVDANGAVTLGEITQGSHVVQLSGLAENCAVVGDNPRAVVVPSGNTLSLSFLVMCRPRSSIS